MNKIIYAKIVQIISNTQVIIDKGEVNGIKIGMKFVIYDEGEEILDPVTKVSLGKFEIQKGNVIVKQTMPGMSLLETEEKLEKRESALSEAMKTISGYNLTYTIERVKQKLEIDPKSINVTLFKKRLVSVGDKVRSVIS